MQVQKCSAGVLFLLSAFAVGGPVFGAADDNARSKTTTVDKDVARVAAMIDRHIGEAWKRNAVKPAPAADDAEFVRRVYLSIAGRIPRVSEVRAFLNDRSPNKRQKLVKDLLETPGYITHYTTFWRNVMMPEASADIQVRFLIPGFDGWLREELRKGTTYDKVVKEILTTKLTTDRNNRGFAAQFGTASPRAFFQAKQAKPENLAAAVSRMFLGVRIECAQCHDHPEETWQREEFWSFAAFFAGIERSGTNVFSTVREVRDRREIAIPESKTVVQAKFLDGKEPQWRFRQSARDTLAKWITAKDNPYFAKMAVNRMWGKLFGVGIVDPVDDFTKSNAPSHPELLDELAKEFVKHEFDLKFLIRAIAASKTFQLTSRKTDPSQSNPQLFARMASQGLTPEQMFDSLALAVGYYQPFQNRNPFVLGRNDARGEITELFKNDSDVPTERSTTILQALALMNGRFIADATNIEKSRTLGAVLDMPFTDTAGRIETLYLSTLSRKPRPDELARMLKYVKSGGPKKDPKKTLADVFWALLNSSEFSLNH